MQDKADLLYNDDQQSFLASLMDLSMEPVDRALADNLSLSLEDYAEALRGAGLISAGATEVLRESGGSVWLSEHHLYGTAALGIRSYPDPGAGSSSELRSSYWENRYGLSTPKEWYSCGYGEVVSAGQRVPWGAWSRTVVAELHHTVGLRQYSVSDHLGNVLATVLDRKSGHGSGPYYDYWLADVSSATDYYPFGMPMQERVAFPERYRLGYNGKQKDDEVYGKGAFQDYGLRMYDNRLARFWGVDPLTRSYPWYTPYQFAGNTPIQATDLDGAEEYHYTLTWNAKTGSKLTLTKIVTGYDHKLFGVKIFHTDILKGIRRAVVNYGQDVYRIGFAGDDFDAMDIFDMWKQYPQAERFTQLFMSEKERSQYNPYVYDLMQTMRTQFVAAVSLVSLGGIPTENLGNSEARKIMNKGLKRQGLDESSIPRNFKEKWTEDGIDYSVRIHDANPEFGKTGSILRVARKRPGLDAQGQGNGWEYLDHADNCHAERDLKKGNPNFNEGPARDTHMEIRTGTNGQH